MGLIGIPRAYSDRLAFLEGNLAINTLRDQIDAGWSVLKMIDGIADEFEDQAGIGALGGATYDATGDYIHNPSTPTTSYANAGGTGDRTSSITVTNNGSGWINTVPGSQLVNGNLADWAAQPANADVTGNWYRLDFGSDKYFTEIRETFQNTTVDPSLWKWQGSTDGSNWTDLTAASTWNAGTGTTETKALTGNYGPWRYLRKLGVSGTSSAACIQYEVEFSIGATAGAAANVTTVSAAYTAQSQPSEARLVLLHQPVDTVMLNVDVTVEASRDGGTTWTAGTLVDEGAFDSSTNILTATVDLSGQPAGTSMKWRYKTLNSKTQRLHGVWMQWR